MRKLIESDNKLNKDLRELSWKKPLHGIAMGVAKCFVYFHFDYRQWGEAGSGKSDPLIHREQVAGCFRTTDRRRRRSDLRVKIHCCAA